MKNTAGLVFFLLVFISSIEAQFISPVPMIEKEVRDNSSVKLRSIELDRIKREARKTNSEKLGPAAVNNFLEIKEDFEKIQKLENSIIIVYTTGKQIQYSKIASFSAEINTSAARLKTNLFSLSNKDRKELPVELEKEENGKTVPIEVKNLIVELDSAIGAFVNNPIFQNSNKTKLKDKAEADLRQIIRLSAALKAAAERQTQAKN
jgi:hypothetical protein